MLVLTSVDRSRHQTAIERHTNVMLFNLTCMDKKLLMLGHTSTQSMNILTFKQIVSDEKSWIAMVAFNQYFQDREDFFCKPMTFLEDFCFIL